MTTQWKPCDCAEARLLREWLTDPRAVPDGDLWPVAWLLSEQIAVHQLRQVSHDLAGARDWSAFASRHVTYAELQRRRGEPGPIAEQWRERHGGEYQGRQVGAA